MMTGCTNAHKTPKLDPAYLVLKSFFDTKRNSYLKRSASRSGNADDIEFLEAYINGETDDLDGKIGKVKVYLDIL